MVGIFEILKCAVGHAYGIDLETVWPDVPNYVESLKVLSIEDKADDNASEFTDAQLVDFFQNLDLSSTYNLVRAAVVTVIFLNGVAAEVIRTLTHAGTTQLGHLYILC